MSPMHTGLPSCLASEDVLLNRCMANAAPGADPPLPIRRSRRDRGAPPATSATRSSNRGHPTPACLLRSVKLGRLRYRMSLHAAAAMAATARGKKWPRVNGRGFEMARCPPARFAIADQ